MTKTITIDGREIVFKSSAAIPRLYRLKFHRDIFSDLAKIDRATKEAQKNGEENPLPVQLLTTFENIAFLMARHADKNQVPQKTAEEWLDTFDTFSIYLILPELLELWGANMETLSEPKKKFDPPNGK